jgi:RNA-directed DNA polymerase
MVALRLSWRRWGHMGGYRRCRPSFTDGPGPMLAAGSMICSTSAATRLRWWWLLIGSQPTGVLALRDRTGSPWPASSPRSGPRSSWTTCALDSRVGQFRPQPVRERKIPKPGGSGKVRRLGIPTVADRVVQTVVARRLEAKVEPIFHPDSYGYRPRRSALDAVGACRERCWKTDWVIDLDIQKFFDRIDHAALMGRVRHRIKDKRVLLLVKAFLKAGILTELGDYEDTQTGTPQGGILSPLLANIALSALDEYLHAPWKPGGPMSTSMRRKRRGWKGLPNWRLVRYADDFVVLVWGDRHHVAALREEITEVLAPMGLRLSESKTQIVHFSDGFDFLGFHIQWRPKKGTNKWYVYTFVAKRPLRSVKAKIRALTRRTSQHPLGATLDRVNSILRGWTAYFRHAVASGTFDHLQKFVWWRIVRWQRAIHRWRWTDVRRWLTDPTGRWHPISADGITLFNPAAVPIRRYRYRGNAIPTPWADAG